MKRKYNIIKAMAFAIGLGATFTACDLDLLPLNDVVLENFWKDKSDVDGVLNSCYVGMQGSYIEHTNIWGEVRSDNIDQGKDVPTNLQQIIKGNLKQTNAACDWGSLYTVINRCNTLLYYAPIVAEKDPNFTQSDLEIAQAEARGLRALAYFYLIRTFKDVPFSFEPSIDDSQEYIIPATKHEKILDVLISDIEECKDWAMKEYSDEQKNSARITRVALYSLLADMYLWKASDYNLNSAEQQRCYRRAIECADYVIEFKQKQYKVDRYHNLNTMMDSYVTGQYGYPLIAESSPTTVSKAPAAYNAIFGKGNSYESIFEVTFDHGQDDAKNTVIGYMYGAYNKDVQYVQQLTANQSLLSDKLSDKNYKDDVLFPVMTDYRSLTSFRYTESGTYPILKYHVNQFTGTAEDFGQVSAAKWAAGTKDAQNQARTYYQLYNGWIIYRLTDVMLMRAEAEIQLAGLMASDVDWSNVTISTTYRSGASLTTAEELYMDAFNIISAVYMRSNPAAQSQKASAPDIQNYTTFSEFQTLCENERHRELLFEGKRYYDLVRRARREGNTEHFSEVVAQKFGDASKAVMIKMSMMDFMYMPYAEHQLDVNPSLKQNPAYAEDEDIVKN